MSVTVQFSSTLQTFTDRLPQLTLEAQTVDEALTRLEQRYPAATQAFFDGDNHQLRPFICLYRNDEPLTLPQDRTMALADGDRLLLLPIIAGGAGRESIISDQRRKEQILDEQEIDRYSNHLLLKDVSVKGQKRLKAARVLIAGLGALGCAAAQYLAAAGVGTIGLVDHDLVALSNLQTQVLHGTRDVRRPKVASVKDSLRAINPRIAIETYHLRLAEDNVDELVSGYDVVVDATDNYKARYLINDSCTLQGIPVVFGAMYQYEGRVTVYDGKNGPCLRCQFPAPPPPGLVPTCSQGGVVSPLPGVIGSFQAGEVLKLLIGGGEPLIGRMLVIQLWQGQVQRLVVKKSPNCPLCGPHPTIVDVHELDYDELCGLKQETEQPVEGITPEELARRIDQGEPMTLVDVREPHERSVLRFPGAIVIPIGQLARRQKELDPEIDTIFLCREGKRSILAINTLREAGYKGPMYNLLGGVEATKHIIFANEGGWL
jgi:adenylyltransferase/sulfurtransferase